MLKDLNKGLLSTIILILFFVCSGTALAVICVPAPDVRVLINDKEQLFDTAPVIVEGRTMLPLRAIFEKLGAAVSWNEETRTIYGAKEERTVTLTIGSTVSRVSGTKLDLDSPPLIVEGRTMVPVRFIAESLGARVEWDPDSRTININEDPKIKPQIFSQDLRGLDVGQSISDAENILGKPSLTVPGPLGMEWRTYHNNYLDYYIIIYSQGKIVSIFTNQPGETYAGVSVGEADPGLGRTATYNEGSLSAVYYANDNVRLKSQDGRLVLYYLDMHENNKVAAVRVISPELILKGMTIMGCQVRYSDSGDLPERLSFCSSESSEDIMEGQSRISFELMNTSRVSRGLAPLVWNDSVSAVAALHSRDMMANDYFAHTSLTGTSPSDRLLEGEILFRISAENISMQEKYFDAVESHYLFMNSLGHRQNILNSKLYSAGVGAAYGNSGMYFTQNFITP